MIWRWLKRIKREMEAPPRCTCGESRDEACPVIAWLAEQQREDLPVARVVR